MRVVFLGNARWSVPSLRGLVDDGAVELPLVVTRVPRPAGRGSTLRPTAVADAARNLGLPLLEVERVGEHVGALREAAPDVIVVVAYGEILKRDVLDVATSVNVHFSLLPRWRGAAPVQRAILAGDEVTGVTTMLMDEGLDTGSILLQERVRIEPGDDAGSLGDRLAVAGGGLLGTTLARLHELEPRPQQEEGVTLAPKLEPQDRSIDWAEPAAMIVRRVRALAPTPGAVTTFRDRRVKVLEAQAADSRADDLPPGTVRAWRYTPPQIWVATGEGDVALVNVVPSGRARMDAGAWIKGIRDPVFRIGERFG